jgi:hypothetical protein
MSRRPRRPGQALTEFALVLPIFVLLLFGVIDIARYVFIANALNNGAREGARAGAVAVGPPVCLAPNPDLNRYACAEEVAVGNAWGQGRATMQREIICQAVNAAGSLVPATPGWFAASPPARLPVTDCGAGDLLTVRTQTTFSLVTPLVGQFVGNLTLRGEAKVTISS